MKLKIPLVLMIVTSVFSSCSKDKYQPKGNYVTTGTNVNTVKTYDFTVDATDWSSSAGTLYYLYSVPYDVDMGGSVMVYYNSGGYYTALPFVVSGSQSIQFAYTLTGIIEVDLVGIPAQTLSFRAVIIPPNSRAAHPDLNLNDYNEVMAAFSLQ